MIIFGPRKSTRVARSPMKAMNVNKVGSQYQTKRKAAVTTPPLTAGYQSHSQPGKTPKAQVTDTGTADSYATISPIIIK